MVSPAFIQAAGQFFHDHSDAFLLLALAGINSMPKALPWPFRLAEPIEWAWEWTRATLIMFASSRSPQHTEVAQNTETRVVTEPNGRKTETASIQAVGEVKDAAK